MGIGRRGSGIQEDHRRISRQGFELNRPQGLESPVQNKVQGLVTRFVKMHIVREISRWGGNSGGQFLHKSLFGHLVLKGVVDLLLVSQGIKGFFAHVFAAGRTGTVGGVNQHRVRQRHDFGTQGTVEGGGHFLGGGGGSRGQIGTAHIADKEGIPAKQGMRLTLFVPQQIARTLRRMPRRMQNFEAQFPEPQHLPILGDMRLKPRLRLRAKNHRGPGRRRQIQVSRNKIGMEMGLNHVFDAGPVLFGTM